MALLISGPIVLGTQTDGNYVADVAGSGSGISVSHTAGEGSTATVSHADTSSVGNISSDNSGGTTFIQDISFTFDTFGHVTAASVATGTVSGFLTSESDTLATVTARGATTTVASSFSGSSASPMLTANNSGAGASLRVVKELEFLSSNGTNTINVLMESTSSLGTLSFEGSTGQLFSVTDSMTGVIYSVNDVSGIPSIEVYDTGQIRLAEYSGRILVGTNTDFDSTSKLQVNGAVLANTIKFRGSTSGTTVLQASAAAGSTTITLPAVNGNVITTADSGTVTSTMIADATIVNGDISASAAIAYSKLSLTGSIVNADIATGAAIATSKISGLATSATTDTTSATNITSGTLPGDRGVTAGSTSSSFVEYNGTTATSGQFDGGTTNPSATTRLNYGGYLYATRFYGDGSQLTGISAGATISDDTSTNATRYPLWEDATSGTATTVGVSSTKLTFNPSTGTFSATVLNSLSDERHKKNITKINNATDLIKLLDGVEFEWLDNDKKSSGLIAQWVEKILPHLVDTTETKDGNEMKTLNYSGLIGYLVESIKELSDRITTLETNKKE